MYNTLYDHEHKEHFVLENMQAILSYFAIYNPVGEYKRDELLEAAK